MLTGSFGQGYLQGQFGQKLESLSTDSSHAVFQSRCHFSQGKRLDARSSQGRFHQNSQSRSLTGNNLQRCPLPLFDFLGYFVVLHPYALQVDSIIGRLTFVTSKPGLFDQLFDRNGGIVDYQQSIVVLVVLRRGRPKILKQG